MDVDSASGSDKDDEDWEDVDDIPRSTGCHRCGLLVIARVRRLHRRSSRRVLRETRGKCGDSVLADWFLQRLRRYRHWQETKRTEILDKSLDKEAMHADKRD